MTFTYNLMIVSLLIFIAFILYKIRQLLPKQKKCWFCHKSQKVSFSQINSFNCLHCHQYNGFSEDGNYNKVISGHFRPTNYVQYCQPISDSYSKCVQLCNECNVKQEIKIKLLAEFIPFNEINFTEECEEYKKYLQKEYKLCSVCETTVKRVLSQPINCAKDVVKDTVLTKGPNIDSVFVRPNIKTNVNWIWFSVINLLEILSLFCAVLCCILGLNDLQNRTELSIIELSESLIQFLSSYASNQTVVLFSGFVSSVTPILISGKQCLLITNIFSQLLWIALISCESNLMVTYIDEIDSILLRSVLSLLLVLFSVINSSLRLFALFKTKSKIKQNLNQTKEQKKYFQNSTNNEMNVCSPESREEKSFSQTVIKSADQSIGEQIKALSILDETDLDSTLSYKQSQRFFRTENNIFSNNCFNSSLITESSNGKSIVLPAKFHYESVAQTSWVSPFKPNMSPRKEKLNPSPYFISSQSFARTSQWVSHHISGLVTPPPSAPASLCSESALVNRFSLVDGNNCLLPHMSDNQRNDLYNSSEHQIRSRAINQQSYSRSSNRESSSEESRVNGSLSSLNNNRTANECLRDHYCRQTLFVNLTQSLVFAVFLLILFCFVIFLSLPIVLKTSCDLHSTDCRFVIENMPQNVL